jgi:hypothetical protein
LRCGFPSSAGLGIHVLMDLVHAHASSNTLDGIAQMDGTDHCCAPENRWKAVSSWSGVVVSTRCHGAGWVELQPDISNDFVWFLRQGSWYYIINVNPGLINHGLLTRGYSSNSHFRWYLNGTLPFLTIVWGLLIQAWHFILVLWWTISFWCFFLQNHDQPLTVKHFSLLKLWLSCEEWCSFRKFRSLIGGLEPWNFMTFYRLGIVTPAD